MTGFFSSSTITFDPFVLTNASTNFDFFLTKYDPSGNALWVKGASGTGADQGIGIVTDVQGNIFVTGYFDVQGISFGSFTLSSAGLFDCFLVKFSSSGNVLWAKSAGGADFDQGNAVVSDLYGNVYVTGLFGRPTISFGSLTISNAGINDAFLAKYDASGNMIWAKIPAGNYDDAGWSLATDISGDVYVAVGSGLSQSFDLGFIVKLDGDGNELCTVTIESGGDDYLGVGTDHYGNAYVGGDFHKINPFVLGSDTLTLTGVENVFVAKYNCCSNDLTDSISGSREIMSGESTILKANVSTDSVNYFWMPTASISCFSCRDITVSPSATTTYTLIVAEHGCVIYDTITVSVSPMEKSYYIPNSFTPNGDGLDDLFVVVSPDNTSTEFKVVVYDRWGAELFRFNNLDKGWDGRYKNALVQEGVYTYEITIIDDQKNSIDEIGRISLIR